MLRRWARRLTGCDLSAGMLAKARARNDYDELVQGELTAFLRGREACFDLLASADTLCYFGDLHDFARAAAGALRPGGRLVFTLESHDGEGFELRPSGRYAHARAHVRAAIAAAGLRLDALETHRLRQEAGEPVAGFLVAAQRPA